MKTPLTIVTGYLGAGKTTLLREIAGRSNMRIAILMNEFGDIAIDSKIVEGKNIRIAELAGGCVCCSLAGEMEVAVAEMLETVKPEWIIIETTGVAEPSALAYDVVENIAGIRLDAIITIVDADAMLRFPQLGHTGREQIELADVLVLNKTDLVSPDALAGIREKLDGINSRAAVVETAHCKVDMKLLFGLERNIAEKKHKTHSIDVEYFDYTGGTLDHEGFLRFLEKLPKAVYRSKGFVKTEKGSYLVNHVAGRHSIEEFAAESTELVFIGKGIESKRIVAGLDRLKRI